jgi:hemolysin D
MHVKDSRLKREVLEYQPDAIEIEERPVPGRVRWVLYIILLTLAAGIAGASIFHVDRIITATGKLITTSPTIVVQPLQTAVIRTIEVEVGDIVEKGQLLATLDSTFARADLDQLRGEELLLSLQIRRIEAELKDKPFSCRPEEGEDGRLQQALYLQRKQILKKRRRMNSDRKAALQAKLDRNRILQEGQQRQLALLRDMEGETARLPRRNSDYRLRLLEAQKARTLALNEMESLGAEETVIVNELKQVDSEWYQFLAEWQGELLNREIEVRKELEKVSEEINKARRLHDLVSLRAPESGTVLLLAQRTVGSIIQQAEPFATLVPSGGEIEVEVNVQSRDIARIRVLDPVHVKLDAFPFQKHDTLPGEVRMISEDAFQTGGSYPEQNVSAVGEGQMAYYRTRIRLLSDRLKNVPHQFRLMPGMKVKAEIKVGRRRIISYFLYPVVRALDESFREP